MKRALISVSDKTGLAAFARGLSALDYEIISTGGTKTLLEQEGIAVTGISEVTGFPEIMDGRVKTLHPKVHGALLCLRDRAEHVEALAHNGIGYIDIVAVNLYPFKKALETGKNHEELIENIDIGGPSMLRSAAKNYRFITAIADPLDYPYVLKELTQHGETSLSTRERLAAKAFRQTAAYDSLIAGYLTSREEESFPEALTLSFEKVQGLRYGENPHQQACFYGAEKGIYSVGAAQQIHGKEMSYNNIQDLNAALEILKEYSLPTVAALKHMNPCGIGSASTIGEAWNKAYEADPLSIFGGIAALNGEVDLPLAEKMAQIFLEIIVAPSYTPEALSVLTKKENLRIYTLDMNLPLSTRPKAVSVMGGMLLQEADCKPLGLSSFECVTTAQPNPQQMEDLIFAWKAVKHVKSNAIVAAKNGQTIGIGAGQMNRVGAAKIALAHGGEKCLGAVLASDAFFPMPDTVEEAAKAGISCIIQPGGSLKDKLSIEACNRLGIAMIFTGTRHFKH